MYNAALNHHSVLSIYPADPSPVWSPKTTPPDEETRNQGHTDTRRTNFHISPLCSFSAWSGRRARLFIRCITWTDAFGHGGGHVYDGFSLTQLFRQKVPSRLAQNARSTHLIASSSSVSIRSSAARPPWTRIHRLFVLFGDDGGTQLHSVQSFMTRLGGKKAWRRNPKALISRLLFFVRLKKIFLSRARASAMDIQSLLHTEQSQSSQSQSRTFSHSFDLSLSFYNSRCWSAGVWCRWVL